MEGDRVAAQARVARAGNGRPGGRTTCHDPGSIAVAHSFETIAGAPGRFAQAMEHRRQYGATDARSRGDRAHSDPQDPLDHSARFPQNQSQTVDLNASRDGFLAVSIFGSSLCALRLCGEIAFCHASSALVLTTFAYQAALAFGIRRSVLKSTYTSPNRIE